MQDAVNRLKFVLTTQTKRIARLQEIVQHDEDLHKTIMADIEKDNEALQDNMLQLSTDLKILREKESKAERQNTAFERDMAAFMQSSTEKLNKINTDTDSLMVKDEIIRSGISASLSTLRELTQKNEDCQKDKKLASVAKAQKLEEIKAGEAKEAEAVAKNQAAENALNDLKETSVVENSRLKAANEAVKTEAAELDDAIGLVNDQVDTASNKKKALKGEIMDTMTETDDIKADTVKVKGEKKKKKMAAFLDDDDEANVPARAEAAEPAPAESDATTEGDAKNEDDSSPAPPKKKFLKSCSARKRKLAKKGDETWCMCNTFGKRIQKKEDCENEGGGRSGVCEMDGNLCVPKADRR